MYLNNLACFYFKKHEYQSAIENYKECLLLHQENLSNQALILNNLGLCYIKLKIYDTALEYIDKSDQIMNKSDDSILKAEVTLIKNSLLIELNRDVDWDSYLYSIFYLKEKGVIKESSLIISNYYYQMNNKKDYLSSLLNVNLINSNNPPSYNFSIINYLLGEFYLKEDFIKSKQYFDIALENISNIRQIDKKTNEELLTDLNILHNKLNFDY